MGTVRGRGGNPKFRALRLDHGNFAWASQSCTRKSRILDVVYNATANELISTKTLVKGAIIQVDSTPFRQWYYKHYGLLLGKKRRRVPPGGCRAGVLPEEDGQEEPQEALGAPERPHHQPDQKPAQTEQRDSKQHACR